MLRINQSSIFCRTIDGETFTYHSISGISVQHAGISGVFYSQISIYRTEGLHIETQNRK